MKIGYFLGQHAFSACLPVQPFKLYKYHAMGLCKSEMHKIRKEKIAEVTYLRVKMTLLSIIIYRILF